MKANAATKVNGGDAVVLDALNLKGLSNAERKLRKQKLRKKLKKTQKKIEEKKSPPATNGNQSSAAGNGNQEDEVEVEYVTESDIDSTGMPEELKGVFQRFSNLGDSDRKGILRSLAIEEAAKAEIRKEGKDEKAAKGKDGGRSFQPLEDAQDKEKADSKPEDVEDEANEDDGLSKKKKKLLSRLTISELKQMCAKPEVVEVWDTTAHDPELLVYMKSYRNSVPVPVHWSQKRKFLQGKRGIEKPPFKLPDFITATGIERMRQALQEKEDAKKLKSKTRERLNPRMGKIDIDYQVLHDAFFKYQTKPKLTKYGDLYYEGKEFEVELQEKRPGHLSLEAKAALGMTDGAPPPWLINMQRYGLPPSYPSLPIPGLNAPIPEGASFGYHPGGWGKPPVDEYGNPLYGDVFGMVREHRKIHNTEQVSKDFTWGEMDVELEEESSEEEVEEMDEEEEDEAIVEEPAEPGYASMQTGMTSDVPAGEETPSEAFNLRKDTRSFSETPVPQDLYQVLPEKAQNISDQSFMASDHVYQMSKESSKEEAVITKQAKTESKKKKEFKF